MHVRRFRGGLLVGESTVFFPVTRRDRGIRVLPRLGEGGQRSCGGEERGGAGQQWAGVDEEEGGGGRGGGGGRRGVEGEGAVEKACVSFCSWFFR